MSYKTLLAIHPTHDPLKRLDPMIQFARSLGAQLHVLVLNLATPIPTMTYVQNPEYDWGEGFRQRLHETAECEDAVRGYLAGHLESCMVYGDCNQMGLIDETVGKHAIYADLILCSGGLASLTSGMMAHALEGALFNAGRPILALPFGVEVLPDTPHKITVAWDETPQAARAVAASLPLLRSAANVEVLVVWGKEGEDVASRRAKQLQTWLFAHAVTASTRILACDGQTVSHALVNAVNDNSTDMLVMGAYGHARIGERLFAGATHVALSDVHVPMFMAH